MWLFNEDGFFSITTTERGNPRKMNEDGELYVCVRSRDEDSLTQMLKSLEMKGNAGIVARPIVGKQRDGVGTDYLYRTILAKEELGRYLYSYSTERLNYRSFKDGMAKSWEHRPDALLRNLALNEVWYACKDFWPDTEDDLTWA